MKMLILAAGEGKRLQPLTDKKPKCMVEYQGKPIIDYILSVAKVCNLDEIAIVNGYKKDVLENYLVEEDLLFYTNTKYKSTNMVATLFSAKEFMNDDLIISYSDIIYTKSVLQQLMQSQADFSVVVDLNWRELWEKRMENPLDDVETLKINNGNIIEIGKKPKSYNDIEAQYIGLIKISKNVIKSIINFYENLDKGVEYDGQDFNSMYMTSFIQRVIDNVMEIKPVYIEGGWIEIDTVDDLEVDMNLSASLS